MNFRFTQTAIDTESARRGLQDPESGGYASFEGWVRDHNEGQEVTGLEYEAFQELAVKEGDRIVAEALRRFPVTAKPSMPAASSSMRSSIAYPSGRRSIIETAIRDG
jgi:molybdopterin synthase catalytic subunit